MSNVCTSVVFTYIIGLNTSHLMDRTVDPQESQYLCVLTKILAINFLICSHYYFLIRATEVKISCS